MFDSVSDVQGRAGQGRHANLRPELVKKYLGTVVPISDNSFATLKEDD
jgi:hypothetical protein